MIVLASSSPRRRELLQKAAIPFTSGHPEVDEAVLPGESAVQMIRRLARDKALSVARNHPRDFVLGADTVVVVGSGNPVVTDQNAGEPQAIEVLGKPANGADAARMLRALSGRTHRVITGVCLITPLPEEEHAERSPGRSGTNLDSAEETTLVTMSAITELEIAEYVSTGEPLDKAGAYAIQGIASRWVARIEGCYFNVVGLPIPLIYRMLRARKAI